MSDHADVYFEKINIGTNKIVNDFIRAVVLCEASTLSAVLLLAHDVI